MKTARRLSHGELAKGLYGLRSARRFLSAALVLALLFSLAPLGAASAAEGEQAYKLNALDRVRLKVYEWRASRDEIYEWKALNAEYTIGASGRLALPLIGEVAAAGTTSAELADLVAEKLKSRIGLIERPDVSIEVVQFRPIYVAGQVEKPGEYPFRPGMTVLQAVTLGGGLLRGSDSGMMRLEREVISSKGDLELLANEFSTLLARKARLEAELKHADKIAFPATLTDRKNETAIVLLIEQEELVFKSRKEGMETQLKALKQLKGFLEKEAASLTAQLGVHDRQVKLMQQELDTVTSLSEKGLTTASRRLAMERSMAQLEGENMRLGTNLLRAKQEISRTEISMLELNNKRIHEVTAELQQTQGKLEQIAQKTETSERLLYESEVIAPRYMADRGRSRSLHPRYTIFRVEKAGRVSELPAKENTLIEPGDTVKIEVPSIGDGSIQLPPQAKDSTGSSSELQRFSLDGLTRMQK